MEKVRQKGMDAICTSETMMNDLIDMHRQFFHILTREGKASFDPSPFGQADQRACTFLCHCVRQFTTAQGLATHRRQKHQEFSIEHDLIEGTTCPECLRHFWSKQRLYQHLSYISRRTHVNVCYQALRQRGFKADVVVGPFHQLPKEVRGLGRVEAQQTLGPRQPLEVHRQQALQPLQDQIASLREQLTVNRVPENPEDTREQVYSFLTKSTLEWFQQFCQEGFDEDLATHLPDLWLAVLFQFEEGIDEWIEAEILAWGQTQLPDIIATFVDGVAEKLVDEQYAQMIDDFPRQQTLKRIAQYEARLRDVEAEGGKRFPHRAVRCETDRNANAGERAVHDARVVGLFSTQTTLFEQISQAKWTFQFTPRCPSTRPSERNLYSSLRTFSGRRRAGDVHDRLLFWANQNPGFVIGHSQLYNLW